MNPVLALLVVSRLTPNEAGQPSKLTAAQIITKSLSSYDSAKTVKATVAIRSHYLENKYTDVKIDLVAENNSDGTIARSTMDTELRTSGRGAEILLKRRIIDDGTTVYLLIPDTKKYSETPHSPDRVSGVFRRSLENARKTVGKLSVSTAHNGSVPVYRITGSSTRGNVTIVIDKMTFQHYSLIGTAGHGPDKVKSEVIVSSQSFNKPIGTHWFQQLPPPGFTKEEPAERPTPQNKTKPGIDSILNQCRAPILRNQGI